MQGLLSRATVNARKRGKNILEECQSAEKSRAMLHFFSPKQMSTTIAANSERNIGT